MRSLLLKDKRCGVFEVRTIESRKYLQTYLLAITQVPVPVHDTGFHLRVRRRLQRWFVQILANPNRKSSQSKSRIHAANHSRGGRRRPRREYRYNHFNLFR